MINPSDEDVRSLSSIYILDSPPLGNYIFGFLPIHNLVFSLLLAWAKISTKKSFYLHFEHACS